MTCYEHIVEDDQGCEVRSAYCDYQQHGAKLISKTKATYIMKDARACLHTT